MEKTIYTLDLSWKTIARVIFAVAIVFLLLFLRDLMISFLFALVLAIILKSAIVFFHKTGIPYWASAIITYVLVFGLIALIAYLSVPLVFIEIRNLTTNIHEYLTEAAPFLSSLGFDIDLLTRWAQENLLPQTPETIIRTLDSVMGGLASTFFVILMALFISLERKGIESTIAFLTPADHQSKVIRAWTRSRKQVTHWFGLRIISALFILTSYFLTYQLFGVRAAFILALIAGMANFIPFAGSLLAALLAVVVIGLQLGWATALIVLGILSALQAIDSYILSPLLARKMIGLPPYLMLFSLAIGGALFGVVGAFLAIPMAGVIYQFIIDLRGGKYEELEAVTE